MLDGRKRSVWLRVGAGIETLSGVGRSVWNEPASARNALRELLSVLPATHVQIDLASLRRRSDPESGWKILLSRGEDWSDLLRETAAATTDAVRGHATWGLGMPSPALVAAELGDSSERGVLKAGLQLAGFLQGVREGGLGFVALDLASGAVADKAVAPLLRNAEMYGWQRAVVLPEVGEASPGGEIRLAAGQDFQSLTGRWERGELVGGGLDESFWSGQALPQPAPSCALLYGTIPEGLEAAAIVAAGRGLRAWMG
jgi:hypothetical protein